MGVAYEVTPILKKKISELMVKNHGREYVVI
jgi:hypothetical protein